MSSAIQISEAEMTPISPQSPEQKGGLFGWFSGNKMISKVVEKTKVYCFSHIQGCGNIMPDLSDLVPFHSEQVENFYLLLLGQVQFMY